MSGNVSLQFSGIANMLDREYRNTPKYQWARELVRNGIEAGATDIRFGVEWEAVKARGVYRLQYVDDGCGMDRDDLKSYMQTLGKGSKTVGGPHDNYALGCRMTLLPWNPAGVVVISKVEGSRPNMVRFIFDEDANQGDGEYVLVEEEWETQGTDEGSISSVYPPFYDEEEGFDWTDTIPQSMRDAGHGTTFILMGTSTSSDTLNGDPSRNESLPEMGRKYFNTRFWELPEGVSLRFYEFTNRDRVSWPKAPDDRPDGRSLGQWRTARGARAVAEYTKKDGDTTVQASGTLLLPDRTKAHWWLRNDPRVDTGGIGGSASGFLAVLYRGELYNHAYANKEDGDTRIGASVYRQFGIGHDETRKRVIIVLEPPEFDEATGVEGVAPSTGRADLYWIGHGLSSRSVKVSDWAEPFGDLMPGEIQEALRQARDSGTDRSADRDERLKKVMERFTKRWVAPRARVVKDGEAGDTTAEAAASGPGARTPIDVPVPKRAVSKPRRRIIRTQSGEATIGKVDTGTTPASRVDAALGYPAVEWVKSEDINDRGMVAAWTFPNSTHPFGLIEIDETHPVVRGQVDYWKEQYPAGMATDVERIVKDAYEDVAVAKVTHMHSLQKSKVFTEDQRAAMLQNPALTTSLLGLISEDALITPRLGGLGAKRRRNDGD